MRPIHPTTLALAALLAASAAASAESANHYLANPEQWEGKQIKLDVRVVRPVPWQSPVEDLRFFHAFTEDKKQNALAGMILIAVPATDVKKFTDEYSLSATRASESLRGILRSTPTRNAKRPRVFFVDYAGRCADIIAKHKGLNLDAESGSR
ncbi:MAG: hypothetical protein IT577_18725 [Verrucomicrobiae bacterium]|nr:hypothetical protein [Verrucomicrobiae bacterium]